MAHPHLSQALGQGGPSQSEMGQIASTGSSVPPTSSLIKSLLANKVPTDSNNQSANHVASLGLSPTATALPGMTRVPSMNSHGSSVSSPQIVNLPNSGAVVPQVGIFCMCM